MVILVYYLECDRMKVNNAKRKIKVAIVGIGNCCSSLYQGIHYYKEVKDDSRLVNGLMHNTIGGYAISDIEVVAAFDVDARKVGKDLSEAIFAKPNCTKIFCSNIPLSKTIVKMGPVLDGVSPHMLNYSEEETFVVANEESVDVVEELIRSGAEILICYLPVGSQMAVEFYATAALKAKCGFINCMPVFIVSHSEWEAKFKEAGLPCIGDDVKSQVGATIVHRVLVDLFVNRGIQVKETTQPNYGGNTDFLNMLSHERVKTKIISKRETIECLLPEKLPDDKFYAGPAGYIPSQKDNKTACITVKGNQFGDVPMEVKAHLSVEDSPNSAGCIIDAIRILRIALDRGMSGAILPACSYFMKRPPRQLNDAKAREELEMFLSDNCRNIIISLSRIKDLAESGDNYSEVWTRIVTEAKAEADRKKINLDIMSPSDCYNDGNVLLALIYKACQTLRSYGPGYEKNLLLPFSITEKKMKEKMIGILKDYPEINLYAVNVPPDREFISELPNIRGYVGMNEFSLGQDLLMEMLSKIAVSKVVVLRHEENQYAHDLRIQGIISVAQKKGIEVVVCKHTDHETMRRVVLSGDAGVITLGNRGTEQVFALDVNETIIPVVTVDSNKKIERFSVESNKRILSTFIQEGLYGQFLCTDKIVSPMKLTA